jgi:type IV pilus assembly protein PilW
MQGMTIVELIVVLALSLGVIGTISQVFLASKRNYIAQAQIAEMQANARHALQSLSDDIRMAGYLGENQEFWNIVETSDNSQDFPANITDECFKVNAGGTPFRWIAPFIENDGGAGANVYYGPTLAGQDDAANLFQDCIDTADNYQGTTDVISLHYVGPDAVPDVDSGNGLQANTYYARVNLTGGIVFQCDATEACVPTGAPAGTNYPLNAITYFVSSCADAGDDDTCGTADDIPGLKKVWLKPDGSVGKATVAEGVVNMQIRYGRDTDGDDLPDRYYDATGFAFNDDTYWDDWAEVRSVRIWLLMRSDNKEPGYVARAPVDGFSLGDQDVPPVDGYRYQVFNMTVSLRNG